MGTNREQTASLIREAIGTKEGSFSAAFFEALNQMPAAAAIVGKDQRYRAVNKTYELWFHESRITMRGKTVREIIGDDAYRLLQPDIYAVLAGKTVSKCVAVPYRVKGATVVNLNLIPVPDGYVAIIVPDSEELYQT